MPERTYTEHEITAIYARAAERQSAAPVRDASLGLTLAEVEQAGQEAGLDAALIRAAAVALDAGHARPARPKIVVAERWVEARLNAGAWEDLVGSLRRRFGTGSSWGAGDTASLGAAQEWTHTALSGVRTTVTLSPRQEGTLLRVQQEASGFDDARTMGWLVAAVLALVPSMLSGALVAETLAFGDVAGVAALLIVFASCVALGGPWLTARTRRGRVRLAEHAEHLADDLASQLSNDTYGPTARNSNETRAPRLDLSALAPTPSDAEKPAERRRTRS